MAWMKKLGMAVALSLAFCAQPVSAQAQGGLHYLGKFVNSDSELHVMTYSKVTDKGLEGRIFLLGIQSNTRRNSVAFGPGDFPAFLRLWQSALKQQSDTWQPVGDYVEHGTKDVSHLKVSAGPGIRFVIESPARGAFTSELQPSNYDAFGSALETANLFLENK